MKILEAAIWILILSIIMIWWVSLLFISQWNFTDYLDKLQDDSQRISLYNYSKYLVEKTSSTQTGFLFFSGDSYYTWASWDYYYDCKISWWKKIETSVAYTWVFCTISYGKENIYNYKLFNN